MQHQFQQIQLIPFAWTFAWQPHLLILFLYGNSVTLTEQDLTCNNGQVVKISITHFHSKAEVTHRWQLLLEAAGSVDKQTFKAVSHSY